MVTQFWRYKKLGEENCEGSQELKAITKESWGGVSYYYSVSEEGSRLTQEDRERKKKSRVRYLLI
jgi:hypothetical protein